MAKDELALVDYYFEHKGWELVADEKRRADKVRASSGARASTAG